MSAALQSLREQLAARFPQVAKSKGVRASGVACIDGESGGLPGGAVTEVVCARPSAGGQTLLGGLARAAAASRGRVGWIEVGDGFDPDSWGEELLLPLVWVRAQTTDQAVQVTDLFVRDPNFELVALDLRESPAQELRRVPATTWYRLQRALEPTGRVLVVLTARALVPSAMLRLELGGCSQNLDTLVRTREECLQALPIAVRRQRLMPAQAAG